MRIANPRKSGKSTSKEYRDGHENITFNSAEIAHIRSIMPRKARIDAPGALHHIICRGIERRQIFEDAKDRNHFVERLGTVLQETSTGCYCWALFSNHFRLLLGIWVSSARRHYLSFLEKGIAQGRRADLIGGGLIRSSGGWAASKAKSKERVHLKGDERILGDSDFVTMVLETAQEEMQRRYRLETAGFDFGKVVSRVAQLLDGDPKEIMSAGKQPLRVKARSLVCYWAVKELGMAGTEVVKLLGLTQPAVSKAVQRGERIANEDQLKLE